ncbi:HAD-IIIA family hydrolase [Parapedobacter sp. ISTM3]|uniref:3-deoxy-D-manno-octulosonate 8-phosphate phosphatase (KDO 8-P phosphatase) n=1 Tax=Parapedobacter luteus TaxID=623280 RepID=A0A1T5CD96_9SPHI|nr:MULTISPECIES: HAD-IIIA family hydrolase [Parapedobacter]MBK1439022.1 HAD-IIIA family hydrolase [Parapedobacter sp. ISTM3]SKB57414.1 3-deoxy-D-manno-octulosonate 8-phosphate phosphatase (KDO 8-P phosphatase) [Parapedobacter luteus]
MLFDRFKQVKAFVFDVDGVLSDGNVLVTEHGEQLRSFNIKDGYAMQLAVKKKYPIAVITGGKSLGVKKRLAGLGITDVFLGVDDKSAVFHDWLSSLGLSPADVLYMGDDIPDLANMRIAGLPACPADAVEEIKAVAAYISFRNGGTGAVRDVMEKVMKLQGTWEG